MISDRCSSLPRLGLCSPSQIGPAIWIERGDSAARLGSGSHELFSAHIDGREHDVGEVAKRWDVEPGELGHLFSVARSYWSRLESQFPNAITEHEFEPAVLGGLLRLTGHADVLSLSDDGTLIRILDLKTGWGDALYELQLRGYALLALREMPMADKVQATILKLRAGETETYEWTRSELEEWATEFANRLVAEREIFRPSVEACGYCPRAHECPARAAWLKQSSVALTLAVADAQNDEPIVRTPDNLCRLLEAARYLKKECEIVEDLVKAEVRNMGGTVRGATKELRISDTIYTSIDYAAGEDVLRARLGDRIGDCLEVSKTKAVDAVRAKAPRGKKKEAEEALLHELDQAAALRLKASPRLEIKQVPKLVTNGG